MAQAGSSLELLGEKEALELAHRILGATGYDTVELECEPLERGWKLFSGDDEGAVRITIDYLALHRYQFDTLKMWWTDPGRTFGRFLDRFYRGESQQRPGGHLLWTPVLKARTAAELEATLTHAEQMRELMLTGARRRWLAPRSCRLVHIIGRRTSGYGETGDGWIWSAETRDHGLKLVRDTAPLWWKLSRPFKAKKGV